MGTDKESRKVRMWKALSLVFIVTMVSGGSLVDALEPVGALLLGAGICMGILLGAYSFRHRKTLPRHLSAVGIFIGLVMVLAITVAELLSRYLGGR